MFAISVTARCGQNTAGCFSPPPYSARWKRSSVKSRAADRREYHTRDALSHGPLSSLPEGGPRRLCFPLRDFCLLIGLP